MRISTAQLFRLGTDAMLRQQLETSRTQLQIATGKKLLAPSDDPASAARVIDLDESISRINQYERNAETATVRLEQEDRILDSITNLLQRVRELNVQGNSDTLGTTGRQAIASEVGEHIEAVVQLMNSRDANGEYLFAGNATATKPFSHDGLGNFTYAGDAGQRHLQIGPDYQLAVGDPGSDVFMNIAAAAGPPAVTDIGSILYDLQTSLNAGAGNQNTLAELDNALESVLQGRSRVGARMVALDEQEIANASVKLTLEQNRSSLEDLDYAEAISNFNRQMLALEASQQSFVKIQGLSLFDYL